MPTQRAATAAEKTKSSEIRYRSRLGGRRTSTAGKQRGSQIDGMNETFPRLADGPQGSRLILFSNNDIIILLVINIYL